MRLADALVNCHAKSKAAHLQTEEYRKANKQRKREGKNERQSMQTVRGATHQAVLRAQHLRKRAI